MRQNSVETMFLVIIWGLVYYCTGIRLVYKSSFINRCLVENLHKIYFYQSIKHHPKTTILYFIYEPTIVSSGIKEIVTPINSCYKLSSFPVSWLIYNME